MSADVIEIKPPHTAPSRETIEHAPWLGRRIMITLHVPNFCFVDKIQGKNTFSSFTINYVPVARLLGPASFAEYLNKFTQFEASIETIVDKVADDLGLALEPEFLSVQASSHSLGGVSIEARAERSATPKQPVKGGK